MDVQSSRPQDGPHEIAAACAEAAQGEVVSPANLNAPGQVVIAGAAAAVARAIAVAKARGARTRRARDSAWRSSACHRARPSSP